MNAAQPTCLINFRPAESMTVRLANKFRSGTYIRVNHGVLLS